MDFEGRNRILGEAKVRKRIYLVFRLSILLIGMFCVGLVASCSDAKDLIDIGLDPPSRQPIDISRTGVTNFFIGDEFGSISQQFLEIRDVLGVKYVRVLFAWTDSVQRGPSASRNYSFYDRIVETIPPGVDVLVVLAHTPNWITNSSNWTAGNPRVTFVEEWVRPTVNRYSNNPRIVGWEVWNEPDFATVASDNALELDDPENYVELLALASTAIRGTDPNSLVVGAATRAVNQNFPTTLDYNKRMKDLGAEAYLDVWNIHYYGSNYEVVVTNNGVKDFLNGLSVPVWVTESGEQGPTKQLPYVETAWPFLLEEVPGIDRFYYFQFASTDPVDVNYGLRTTDPSFPVSDLYLYLRDN